MSLRPLALTSVVVVVGCGPSVGPGTGEDVVQPDASPGGRVDAGPHVDAGPCNESIDVVFVLDVSSSMDFALQDLQTGIGSVVDAANQLAPGHDAHFGLIAFADNAALDTTGDLEGGKVHSQAQSLIDAFAFDRTTYTAANRNPGDGPGGPTDQNPICEENANDALHAAATEFPWRADATHVVIVATDDTFLEAPDNYGDRDHDGDTTSTNYPSEGDYPAAFTLGQTETALGAAKVRVFSVTRLTPPGLLDFTRCTTGRRLGWSHITDGWTTPYGTTPAVPDKTDGQNFDLDAVKNGSLSLETTINQVVLQSHCNPVP